MEIGFDDWRAICETKARYCRCVDAKDWQGFVDCFTSDWILDLSALGAPTISGREAAISVIRDVLETVTTAHQVHSPEIILDGDGLGANVIWAMQDCVIRKKLETGNQRVQVSGFGHYHERYTKGVDKRWRISRTKLIYTISEKALLTDVSHE